MQPFDCASVRSERRDSEVEERSGQASFDSGLKRPTLRVNG